jgi:hypothetical protein
MAHFAKVESGVVTEVIVADQDFIDTQSGTWVKTSYNTRNGKHYAPDSQTEDSGTPLRKNFAGIGFTYDSGRDAFFPPQPYPSWVINETTGGWDAPVSITDDGKQYQWDESITNWKEVT